MTVAEKQSQLIEDFAFIEEQQERLAAVVSHARRLPSFPDSAKTEANGVVGCISQVWITAELTDGRLRLRADADSPLVKGLVALLIELYDNATPADIVATEPVIFEKLDLLQTLTLTRKNGLAAVRARIKALANNVT